MKLKTFAFIGVLVFTLAACKKDEKKLLEGTWQGSDYTIDMKEEVSPMIITGAKQIVSNTTYVFNADGKFTETMTPYKSNGTWTYDSKTKKLSLKYEVKSGPQDIMNPVYEVTSVSASELKLKNSLSGQGFEHLTFIKK